jgi:hypothetical protein
MTIFYRGPCVRITHKVFETRCPIHRSFPLASLRRVRVVERVTDSQTLTSARVSSTGAAGAVAVAIVLGRTEGWEAFDSPITMLGMVLLLIVSVAVSGACWWVDSAELALVALYRGQPVILYASTDPQEFGQVRRALMRALQQLDDAR